MKTLTPKMTPANSDQTMPAISMCPFGRASLVVPVEE
jgi:hypothetical protein